MRNVCQVIQKIPTEGVADLPPGLLVKCVLAMPGGAFPLIVHSLATVTAREMWREETVTGASRGHLVWIWIMLRAAQAASAQESLMSAAMLVCTGPHSECQYMMKTMDFP